MAIRFIYFDLGNVLLHFCHDRMCRQIAAAARVDVEHVRELVLSDAALRAHETGALDAASFHESFCQRSGSSVPFEDLHAAAADIFTLNEPMLPVIDRLASDGHRLGVLSNTNEAHWQFVNDGRFAPLLPGPFEQAVLSFQEGAMKPAAAIYAAAVRRAGVEPHEILFTDDREENVAGACQAGLDAVLFTGADALHEDLANRGVLP